MYLHYQKYIKVKTEDIPNYFKECQFSTHVCTYVSSVTYYEHHLHGQEVLDVLHNIIGFLKANCTREGHTYWLFRQKGEDVVKLYDLTSLGCYEVCLGQAVVTVHAYVCHIVCMEKFRASCVFIVV